MKHINTIKKIVADGNFEEAHSALENLLEMGPSNVEAMKLKAALFAHVGRFEEEELAWRRIIDIDNEDEDAIEFYQNAQIEDREHYYFTDALPGGGRRYLAYPRALITVSFVGLIGCVTFLMLTRAGSPIITNGPMILFTTFLATVISPWFAILYMYAKTIRAIQISREGFEVSTRLKRMFLSWKDIERIVLAHSDDLENSTLKLVVLPKDREAKPISVDLTAETTAVRARRHLLAEMRDYCQNIDHEAYSRLALNPKNLRRF